MYRQRANPSFRFVFSPDVLLITDGLLRKRNISLLPVTCCSSTDVEDRDIGTSGGCQFNLFFGTHRYYDIYRSINDIYIYICIYSWPENPPAVVSSMIFPANQTSMTRPGFSSLPEGTQIEKDRERCGKPIFSMVYTTHLWWFWGWFMIVLTTLDHVRGERWRVFHIVLSTLTQGIATIWSEKNQTTT